MDEDNKLSYFFLGLGIGVAAGILFAPKAGEDTREFLKAKADESKDYMLRRSGELKDSANEMVDRGRSAINRQKDQFAAAVEAGKQAYREAVSNPEDERVRSEGR